MAWTFLDLFNSGYLVHTFPEFLGTKKVEKGTAAIETKESEASLEALLADTLTSNFPISDVFVTVTSATGKVVFSKIHRALDFYIKSMELAKILPCDDMAAFKGTLKIECQLYNGEKLVAFDGTFNA